MFALERQTTVVDLAGSEDRSECCQPGAVGQLPVGSGVTGLKLSQRSNGRRTVSGGVIVVFSPSSEIHVTSTTVLNAPVSTLVKPEVPL